MDLVCYWDVLSKAEFDPAVSYQNMVDELLATSNLSAGLKYKSTFTGTIKRIFFAVSDWRFTIEDLKLKELKIETEWTLV